MPIGEHLSHCHECGARILCGDCIRHICDECERKQKGHNAMSERNEEYVYEDIGEPWVILLPSKRIVDRDGNPVNFNLHVIKERSLLCVNSLAGTDDPAAWVKQVRDALMRAERWIGREWHWDDESGDSERLECEAAEDAVLQAIDQLPNPEGT